jgi:hypothetical protein
VFDAPHAAIDIWALGICLLPNACDEMLSVRFGLLKAPLVLARLNIHKLPLLIILKMIALGLDMEAGPRKVRQYGSLIVGRILFRVFA